jgi:hypothetical protein
MSDAMDAKLVSGLETYSHSDKAPSGDVVFRTNAASVTDLAKKEVDFLTRVAPWPCDGALGYINLHWQARMPSDHSEQYWSGKPTQSVKALVELTQWARLGKDITDIYYCLSLQNSIGKNRNGKAKVLRLQKNAIALKSVWLDIDIKEAPKGYPSLNDALDALGMFRRGVGLPPPTALVASGGGLHVYWISDKPLTPDEWRPYAEGLKTAAINFGLRCDAGVTTDSARILRVPGTLNHKTNPPKPVKLLGMQTSDISFVKDLALLAAMAPTFTATVKNNQTIDLTNFPKRALPPGGIESLADGLREEMLPLAWEPLVKECAFIRDALITGGKDYSQPMWNLTTLAATWMENGIELAHKMGTQHPGYSRESTDALWKRKNRERQGKGLGWPSCKAIQAAGCISCAACQHLSKGKSPLHLALQELPSISGDHSGANAQMPIASGPVIWSAASLNVTFAKVPHRHWLYGTYLIRGEITVVAAPGGAGKTALATGMAVEIATGTEVLGEKIWGGHDLKVLFINAEDGAIEIERRVWAFCLAHARKIAGRALNRLYVAGADDPQVRRLSFLRTSEKNLSVLDQNGFEVLEAALEALRPDVLILDPLVAFCGGGNMNDNAIMSLVIRELKHLAAKFDCAVLIVHHTRKGGDVGSAEAISGAAATVNLARRAIMPVPMVEDEAKKFGVLPSERFRYFKVVDAKSNLAPRSADSPWYQLHSVELPNPEPPIYPHGDNVQAISRVNLSLLNNAPAAGDDLNVRRALFDLVARGKIINGQSFPYSPSIAGAKNDRALLADAMAVVVKATAPRRWATSDLEAVTKRTIDKMETEGWIAVGDMKELMSEPGRFRKGRGLTVDRARTPWANASADGGNAAIEGSGQLVNDAVND